MSWHILGAGSLGCLWAARLQLAGQPVHLILRESRITPFQSQGSCIHFTDLQKKQHLLPVSVETAASNTPIHFLILTCKAYAAEEAIASIRHRLSPNCHVILLQNGIGSQQAVANILQGMHILIASTTEGAYTSQDFHCTHAGDGVTLLGELNNSSASAPDWLEQLNQSNIPCQWHPDIQSVLWRKLAINCLINPMTVIHACRNGELINHLQHIQILATELQDLLYAAGQIQAAQNLLATAQQVITSTAANTSSMLQDVQQQRRTEISYIMLCPATKPSFGDTLPQLDHALHITTAFANLAYLT